MTSASQGVREMAWASALWETWPGATDPLQITILRQEKLQQYNSRTAGGPLVQHQMTFTETGDKSFMCFLFREQGGQLTLIVEQEQGLTTADSFLVQVLCRLNIFL